MQLSNRGNSIGALGDFTFNFATGISKPIIGSAAYPQMSIVEFNVNMAQILSAVDELTDTGFVPSQTPLVFTNAINGAIGGTGIVAYKDYIDPTNTEFGKTTLIKQLGHIQ